SSSTVSSNTRTSLSTTTPSIILTSSLPRQNEVDTVPSFSLTDTRKGFHGLDNFMVNNEKNHSINMTRNNTRTTNDCM
ncbi:hypothetical protein HMI55_003739, partial [Coelomomyces lativittatus]